MVYLSTDKNPEINTYVSVGDIYLELVVDRIRKGRRNLKEYTIGDYLSKYRLNTLTENVSFIKKRNMGYDWWNKLFFAGRNVKIISLDKNDISLQVDLLPWSKPDV